MNSNSGENIPLGVSMKASDWIKVLSENVTPGDLEVETLYSLLHHLEDLGLLVHCENDNLKWQELAEGMDWGEQIQIIRSGLMRIAKTELGFAVPFFIGFGEIKLPAIDTLIDSENKTLKNKSHTQREPASDFSNLQIVKKVGRQLKPFLDAESAIVKRLLGKHTNKADARKLFQYMFGKMNSKAQPRKWEQLSRKRHR